MMISETGAAGNQNRSPSGRFEAQHRLLGRKNRRAYLKAGLFLFLALGAGMVIGAGVALWVVKPRMRAQIPRAEQIGRSVLGRLDEAVELTVDEKSRMEEIILSHMTEVDTLRMESLDAIRDEFDRMNDRVDEILGPERSEKWEAEKRIRYGKFYRSKEERHHRTSRRAEPLQNPPSPP